MKERLNIGIVRILQSLGFGAFLTIVSISANATLLNFSITYNGIFQTIDGSSDPVSGTMLDAGDIFNLDVHTEGNDFWRVDSAFSGGWLTNFRIVEPGSRIGNTTASLFLDGVQVAQQTNPNQRQSSTHIGFNTFPALSAGLEFDQIIVNYDFISIVDFSSTNPSLKTTIRDDYLYYSFLLYGNSNISYVEGMEGVVPAPATLALFGLGLAGLGWSRRKKA